MGTNRTFLKATTAITALGIAVSSFVSSCTEKGERKTTETPPQNKNPASWVDKTQEKSDNVLDFKHLADGTIVDNDSTPFTSANMMDHILQACNNKGITKVFFGDCSHIDTKKDDLVINSIPALKDHGFSLAIENGVGNFREVFGKDFYVTTLEELERNKERFIQKNASASEMHGVYSHAMAEKMFQMYLEGKRAGVHVIPCELNPLDSAEMNYISILTRNNSRTKEFPIDMDKALFGELEDHTRDKNLLLPNTPVVISRGTGHIMWQDDANERAENSNSVSIWNMGSSSNLPSFVTVSILQIRARKVVIGMFLDDSLYSDDQAKKLAAIYRDIIKPEKNCHIEIPAFIAMADENGNNVRLYHGETYLKTHFLTQEGKMEAVRPGIPSLHQQLSELGVFEGKPQVTVQR